jgi:hypothetical protein
VLKLCIDITDIYKKYNEKIIDTSMKQAYGWNPHPTFCGVGDA